MSPQGQRLREAHAHIAQHGRAMTMLDLSAVASVEECLERVASHASAGRSGWLLGHGVRVQGWREPRWPRARELDSAAGDRPCCIWSFDHHALVVNTGAMRAAGIDTGSPDPQHGRIERDERGTPTGVMLEAAAKLVWGRIPADPPEERLRQVKAALADLAGHGFVEIHDLLSEPWVGPMLAELDDAGQLPCRVLLYPRYDDLDAVLVTRHEWERERVRLAGAKLFADGTLNARTASMLRPYADPLPGMARGEAMLSCAQIAGAMARTSSLGLTLAVHAIGDAAVRACLDAAEWGRDKETRHGGQAARRRDEGTAAAALRVEHAEIIDPTDVPRFARLGVVCSAQPCHLLADIEVLRRGLPHRLERVFPLRELIDSGCRPGELLWFGSDVPIVRPHPADSIQAAVHRRREGMRADEAIAPEQAISEGEAWACFTPTSSASGF